MTSVVERIIHNTCTANRMKSRHAGSLLTAEIIDHAVGRHVVKETDRQTGRQADRQAIC
jgi:hypothetical protein